MEMAAIPPSQSDKIQVQCGCCERIFYVTKRQLAMANGRGGFSIGHRVQNTYLRKDNNGAVRVIIEVQAINHDLCPRCAIAAAGSLVTAWMQMPDDITNSDAVFKEIKENGNGDE